MNVKKLSVGSNSQAEQELFKIKRDMKSILNKKEFKMLKDFKKSIKGVK